MGVGAGGGYGNNKWTSGRGRVKDHQVGAALHNTQLFHCGLPTNPPTHLPVEDDAEVDVHEVCPPAVQQHVVQVAVAQAQRMAHLHAARVWTGVGR